MIKTRKITKKEIEYYDNCSECNLEIRGSTEGQVEYNMGEHIKKHKRNKVRKNE